MILKFKYLIDYLIDLIDYYLIDQIASIMSDLLFKIAEKRISNGMLMSHQFVCICKKVNELYVDDDDEFFRRVKDKNLEDTFRKGITKGVNGVSPYCSDNMKIIIDGSVKMERNRNTITELLVEVMRINGKYNKRIMDESTLIYELGESQALQKLEEITTEVDGNVGFTKKSLIRILTGIEKEMDLYKKHIKYYMMHYTTSEQNAN